MPPVEVIWYDGVRNQPPLPAELGPDAKLTEAAGKFIYSKTLVFKGGTHGDTLRIIPDARMQELAPTLPKIGGGFSDHAVNFVRGCQGTEQTRSPFSVGGPLTQVFILGIVAQRLGGTAEVRHRHTDSSSATPRRTRCSWALRRAKGGRGIQGLMHRRLDCDSGGRADAAPSTTGASVQAQNGRAVGYRCRISACSRR